MGILQKYHNKLDVIEKNKESKFDESIDNKRAKSYQDPEKESSFQMSERKVIENQHDVLNSDTYEEGSHQNS